MQTLLTFLGGILNGARSVVGLVLPIFADAADFRNWPGWLKALVGLAILGGLCVGAFYLQKAVDLGDLLKHIPPKIRPYYLVLLVLLVVVFSWLAWILWKLLTKEEAAAEFPDIQSAWTEAVKRLDASGMKIGDAPLFLVLGRPAAGTDALFLAASVKDIIRAPATSDPPLRIYAWNDAIFVTCAGASAWGALCGEMTGQGGEASWAGDAPADGVAKTIGPAGFFAGADPVARAEMDELLRVSKERDLSPIEQNRLRQLAEEMASTSAPAKKKLAMPDDVQARYTRRLRYLCKLIRADRRPWCPVNGIVLLVPWDATESDESVRLSSNILSRDLAAARDVLQMRYPTIGVVCDLETARGFDEFRTGFPSEVLKQRIGQRLPLAPDVDADKVPLLLAQAAQWIGLSVLPAWILRFLRLDQADPRQTPGSGRLHNRNLYLLMRGVFDRGPRLAQVLARGLPNVGGSGPLATVPMFGGCYLAATGKDGAGQAFVPGIFERILGSQNAVSWMPDAEVADAKLNQLTLMGYVGIIFMALLAAGASYFMFKK
jgi:hypothetical protein